ncbi:hypothetical protein V8C35DRAFT_312716 [Trichoderma chlorosporum]
MRNTKLPFAEMGDGLHTIYGDPEVDDDIHVAEPEIDVVAVHGLNFKANPNHAWKTWHSRGSLWIRDFLPQKLGRPCRVMLFAYNSSPAKASNSKLLDEHARMLLACLKDKRKDTPHRPIIFLCHSMGGIVVKSAIVEGKLDPAYSDIVKSTRLFVFFATPHLGGNYSEIGDIAAKIVRTGLRAPGNDLLDSLKSGSRDVIRRFEQARHLHEACLVISFYETQSYGRLGLIVEKESAVMNLPKDQEKQVALEADHSKVCKFPTAKTCEPVMGLIATEFDRALDMKRALEPGPENFHFIVSQRENDLFTGRDEIVNRVLNSITSVDDNSIHQPRFVLTGIGGQGKSEICRKVVAQVRNLFWGIFWVDVSSRSAAAAGFKRIAQALGKSDYTDIEDVTLLLANIEVQHNWLLVLDNADDPEFDYQEYIPSGDRGKVLITSRLSECRVYGTAGHEEVGNLSKEDCVSLLFKAAEVPESLHAESLPIAEEIASEVGFHTLALVQAGAYIAHKGCIMADYPTLFRQQRDRLLKFGLPQVRSRYLNVYATFESSVLALEAIETGAKQDALELLHLFSSIHHQDIPLDLFIDSREGIKMAQQNQPGDETIDRLCDWHISQLPKFLGPHDTSWDNARFLSALAKLCALALVKKSDVRGVVVLSLHPLVHEWITSRQEITQRHAQLQSTSCMFALWIYASTEWRIYGDYLGNHLSFLITATAQADDALSSIHAVQCFFQIAHMLQSLRYDEELSSLLTRLFSRLDVQPDCPVDRLLPLYYLKSLNERNRGNVKFSIDVLTKALEIQRNNHDQDSFEILKFETELGNAYLNSGQIKRSIAMLEEIVNIQSTKASLNERSMATLKYELGAAYRADGRNKKAIEAIEQGIELDSRHTGDEDVTRIPPAYELARSYLSDNRIKEAIELFKRTIQVAEQHLRSQHPNRLALQDGLGRALLSNGQTKEAIEIFERIANVEKSSLAHDHPSKLASLHILGAAYNQNGQTKQAIAIFEDILSVSGVAEDHPNRLDTQLALGICYAADGKIGKAISIFEKLSITQEHVFDEAHPSRVTTQTELANAYGKMGDFTKAVNILENVVALQELHFDEGHPIRLTAQYSLALACLNAGQTSRCIALLEEVVRIEDVAVDDNEHQRAVSKQALGRAYLSDGQVKPAIALLEEAIDALSLTAPETHPDLLAAKHELGRSLVTDGQLSKAIDLFEEIVKLQSASLDATHPDQLASKRMLGLAYLEAHQIQEAMNILDAIIDIEKKILDEANPGLLASRHGLARCYLANGQTQEAIALLTDIDRINSSLLTADHLDVLQTKRQLGAAYLKQNQAKEAIAVLTDVAATYPQENHPGRLSARHELGLAFIKDGQVEEGMRILEDVVQNQAHLDEGHPNRLASQYELGCCYLSLRRLDDAVNLLKEVVRVETLTQSRSISLAMTLAKLGSVYLMQGKAKEALEALTSACVIRRSCLAPDNVSRLASEHDLGLAYLETGDEKKGLSVLEELLAVERQCLEQNHPLRLKTQYELACAYLEAAKLEKGIQLLENVVSIKKWHPDDTYPTLNEVRSELDRAYKERSFLYRLSQVFGLNACFDRK